MDQKLFEQGWESFDEFADRRFAEMQNAHREGRPYPERRMTIKKIVKLIEDEYRRKLH